MGHPDFVSAHGLTAKIREHEQLLSRIPAVPDLQSAWSLLVHCATARATFLLRVVRPEMTQRFASAHDAQPWECLCHLLGATQNHMATLPLALRDGLRSAMRTRTAAYWASCGDCLSMIRAHHPAVVTQMIAHLQNPGQSPCLDAGAEAGRGLLGVSGFVPPSWEALANGVRPPPRQPEDFEP